MSSVVRYKSAGPEMLIDMVNQVAEVLTAKGGIPTPDASVLAIEIANQMAKSWGGHFIYFPKGTWNGESDLTCFQLEERDRLIEQEYNGTNREEICARYNISRARLYKIVAEVRGARRARGSTST